VSPFEGGPPGSARNLEKGIKKAKTKLASGPLFKVDH